MHEEIAAMFDLTDKVSLITGGARDLGFDAASVLAAAGSHVAITSRSLESAQKAAAELGRNYGVDALPLSLDQTEVQQVMDVAERAESWKSRIDVLVNNAGGGVGSVGPLFERPPTDIAKMIETNLTGALYCCREVGRVMARQGTGKIINIASIAGMIGRDRRMYDRNDMSGQPIDYAAAKAGVIGMTRDLAGYLSPMGVFVNAISPGGFNRELAEGFVRDYSNETAQGRMGRDGIDLKGAILFLATTASDYVTGVNLPVDGGFCIFK